MPQGKDEAGLIETLPPVQRLALAYASAATRLPLLTLLAFDARLAGIVRGSREPMLAQLRLAWWREQLRADPASRPQGEPLLAALTGWPGPLAALAGLVDGWEGMTGAAPLESARFAALAAARGQCFAALAASPQGHEAARRMGRNWALADIAGRLTHPAEREAALALALAQDWRRAALPRGLRPLAVLHGLAARAIRAGDAAPADTPRALFTAMRIGLLGR